MNSPYLDKPRRSLRQALSDAGREPADAGMDEPAIGGGTRAHGRRFLPFAAIALAVLLAAAGGVVYLSDRNDDIASAIEESGDGQDGVVPASGPDEADEPQSPEPASVEFEAPGTIDPVNDPY